jgi:FKBP-type peptidyl-prolyl cis-trans isomerase
MKILIACFAVAALTGLAACGRQGSVMDEIEKAQKVDAEAAAKNLAEGQNFLDANAKKPGVIVTKSGLQYEIVRPGDPKAPPPGPTDEANVDYEGTLPSGAVFDSSYARGQPAQFGVGGVIAGWTEALQLMHPGAEFRLVIPGALAYGEEGRPPEIPPNQVLIFKVELLGYRTGAGKKVGKF